MNGLGEAPKMLDFYFGLPLWLSGLLVLGAAALVSAGGHWAVRGFLLRSVTRLETELAVALMAVVAAFIGIMLAFAAFQVWQGYNDADTAVAKEAAAISELYRDLAIYGDDTLGARTAVREYVHTVVNDEWPLLAKGQSAPSSIQALIQTFREVGRIEPRTGRETVLYGEIAKKLNEVVDYRRSRIIAASDALPGLFWVVVLAGSGVIVAYTFVFPVTRANTLIIAGLGLSLGLLFMFILDVDHPFAGPASVSDEQLSALPALFEKITAPAIAVSPPK
jgi:hypothetical protein